MTAQKVLKQINDEKELPDLYNLLTAPQKVQMIFKLRESAYGKPATADEQQSKKAATVNVIVRTVGQ